MSRSPSLAPLGPYGGHDERADRRMTPFYATPYSNAPPAPDRAGSRGPILRPIDGDVDDDMDMDADDDRGSSTDPYDSEATNDADNLRKSGGGDMLGGAWDANRSIRVFEDLDADEMGSNGDDDSPDWNSQSQSEAHGQGQPGVGLRPEDVPRLGIEDPMYPTSDDESWAPQSQEIEIHEDRDEHESHAQHGAGASARATGGGPTGDTTEEEGDGDVEIVDRIDDDGADARSDVSSIPSEYPATHRAWHITANTPKGERRAVGDGRASQGPLGGSMGFRIHEDNDETLDTDGGAQW
jgi:hypothetical protein